VKVDNLFQYDNQTKSLPTYEELVVRNIDLATKLVMKGLAIKSLKEDYLALDKERVRLFDRLKLPEILTTTAQEERKKAEEAYLALSKQNAELYGKLALSQEKGEKAEEALAQSREAGMKKAMDLVDEIKENEALKKQIDSLRRSLANEDIINQGLHEKVETLEAQLKQSFLREDCLAHNLDNARDTIRINREYHEADLRRLQNTLDSRIADIKTLRQTIDSLNRHTH
jgi:chromosome segregation ATPase